MLICPNCERDATGLLPVYGYCPTCTRRQDERNATVLARLKESPEVESVDNLDGTFTHTFLFHDHNGNCVCHGCRYHCEDSADKFSVCGHGEWCQVCHEHEAVRGSCEKCDPCNKCKRSGPLHKEEIIEIGCR